MKMKEKSVIWLLLKINLSTVISMKTSRQELSIDMVIHRVICKNYQITLFPVLPSYLKQWLNFTVRVAISAITILLDGQRFNPLPSALPFGNRKFYLRGSYNFSIATFLKNITPLKN